MSRFAPVFFAPLLFVGLTGGLVMSLLVHGCRQDVYCDSDQICIQTFGANSYCQVDPQSGPPSFGQCYLKGQPGPSNSDMAGQSPNSVRTCSKTPDILNSTKVTASANFGASVATNGTEILIGSPGSVTGSTAEVFFSGSGTWQGTSLFTPSIVDSQIGTGLALRSGEALVNAKNKAYLFTGTGSAWSLKSTLSPASGTPAFSFQAGAALTDRLGFAGYLDSSNACSTQVFDASASAPTTEPACNTIMRSCVSNYSTALAVSDPWLIVGGPGSVTQQASICNIQSLCGAAATCSPLSHSLSSDAFGTAVGISGNLAVVGAPGQAAQPFFAYSYDGTSQSWNMGTQPAALSGGSTSDGWGDSLAIDGSLLAVGAPGSSSGSGRVQIYQYLNGTWNQLLDASASSVPITGATAHFGGAVAVSGDLVVVGAPGATAAAQASAGAAVVYHCPAM